MMKYFKKLTMVTTSAFVFLLTAVTGASQRLPLPSITIEAEEDADDITPTPDELGIRPMADDDGDTSNSNSKNN